MRFIRLLCALAVAVGAPAALEAQEGGGADLMKVAAAKKPVKKKAIKRGPEARQLFGAAKTPAPLAARAIGFYAKGCLAGAAALPIDGAAWQAMRLSRNRNWGHPKLVALVEKLALEAKQHDGWPGLLVGDLSQPRGGPMLTGHASHQVGLDADIWLTPMPDRRLTEQEREDLSATSMLAADEVSVDPKVWTDAHVRLLKRAASYAGVERIFVHPAIKKALCDAAAKDTERSVDSKDPRLLGSPLSLPRAHRLPRGQHQLRGPAAARRGRWMRRRAQALARPGEAETATGHAAATGQAPTGQAGDHARSAPRRMPHRAVERRGRARAGGHAGEAGQGARGSQGVRHEIGRTHAKASFTTPARPWAAPQSAAPAW